MSLSEPRVLDCPSCSQRHVDRGEWATKPHRTHLCEFCGYEWRPFPHYTVGVAASPVEIERDSLAQQLAAAREECRDWQDAKRLSDAALGDALDERDQLRRQLAAIEAPTPEDVDAVAKAAFCDWDGLVRQEHRDSTWIRLHPHVVSAWSKVARAAIAAIAERVRGGQG